MPTPYVEVLEGNVLDVLPTLEANSFDACLSDPPYGLSFMGKQWDHGIPGRAMWAELLRVLKPGAFLLAFGGTRTHHRLMCAIEDAGFEIRDCLLWLYGQGFPKSLDIGKAIDKQVGAARETAYTRPKRGAFGGVAYAQDAWTLAQWNQPLNLPVTLPATDAAKLWDGYGTALKPAWEPIIIAMRPCDGTFAENALKHGVAGLNIEAGRIELNGDYKCRANGRPSQTGLGDNYDPTVANQPDNKGRWPANVILDAEAASALDAQSGTLTSGNNPAKRSADKHSTVYAGWKGEQCLVHRGTDTGGASRFFYCAKASRRERGEGNTHPTVKPQKLLEYLARLILPPQGGKLIVPFSGSGSEMLGARNAGWREVTGIEQSADYAAIARKRLNLSRPESFRKSA